MSNLTILARLFFDRGVSAVFIYRMSNWCYLHKMNFLAIILKQLNIFVNRCDIAYQSEIGKGFRVLHAFGTVIVECTIGENFTICHNATIGKSGAGLPFIGNHVTVFPGSMIAGNVTIGDSSMIGANAVVLKDVPANSTVKVESPIVYQREIK
jgi:serine O-acetyltransferase